MRAGPRRLCGVHSGIGDAMRCSKCNSYNREGRKFCGECGAALVTCPGCGASNQPGERFCGECGAALLTKNAAQSPASSRSAADTAITPKQTSASAIADGERKTVTALFADIKGSTELMRDLDPEEARAIIDPALTLMIDAVHRYDGYVVQSTGDGSSHCSGPQSRTKTIPSERCTRQSRCGTSFCAVAMSLGYWAARASKSASESIPAKWSCARYRPVDTRSTRPSVT
jgi:Double zinc ribbon/Adenylate and Guanylate cyclase catalytic domain